MDERGDESGWRFEVLEMKLILSRSDPRQWSFRKKEERNNVNVSGKMETVKNGYIKEQL